MVRRRRPSKVTAGRTIVLVLAGALGIGWLGCIDPDTGWPGGSPAMAAGRHDVGRRGPTDSGKAASAAQTGKKAGAMGAAGERPADAGPGSAGGAAGAAGASQTPGSGGSGGGPAGAVRSPGSTGLSGRSDPSGRDARASTMGTSAATATPSTGVAPPDTDWHTVPADLTQVGGDLSPAEEAALIAGKWR